MLAIACDLGTSSHQIERECFSILGENKWGEYLERIKIC